MIPITLVSAYAPAREPRMAMMPTSDAERQHDDQRAGDEHHLVVRAELLDRPVLQRLRDAVDEHLPDGNDRRRRPLDQPDDDLGRRQTGSGRHETERRHPTSSSRRVG